MTQRKSSKRPSGAAGVKALIATASVAATLAGWAVLPSNDPPPVVASDQSNQQPALVAPGTTGGGSTGASPNVTAPEIQSPPTSSSDQGLPQVQAPGGYSRWGSPFTNTHSSR